MIAALLFVLVFPLSEADLIRIIEANDPSPMWWCRYHECEIV